MTVTRAAIADGAGSFCIDEIAVGMPLDDEVLVEMRAAEDDGRVREVWVTPEGLAAYRAALKRITPDARLIFAEWDEQDLRRLHDLLERLKSWLDDNRETKPLSHSS